MVGTFVRRTDVLESGLVETVKQLQDAAGAMQGPGKDDRRLSRTYVVELVLQTLSDSSEILKVQIRPRSGGERVMQHYYTKNVQLSEGSDLSLTTFRAGDHLFVLASLTSSGERGSNRVVQSMCLEPATAAAYGAALIEAARQAGWVGGKS
jgi:hypothetical protein